MADPTSHLPAGQVHDEFTTWAIQHGGIKINKVKVAAFPLAGIGIVATENIKVCIENTEDRSTYPWVAYQANGISAIPHS